MNRRLARIIAIALVAVLVLVLFAGVIATATGAPMSAPAPARARPRFGVANRRRATVPDAETLSRTSAAPDPSPGTRKRVLVIGDSVLDGAAPQLPAAMPGRAVVVDAMVNRSTKQGLDVVASHGTQFDVVVVQLGTNDAGSLSIYWPRVQRMLEALAPVPLVIWLTVREVRPYYVQSNQLLRDLVPSHPNLAVEDWSAFANQHPEVFSSDGLHLKGAGPDLMALFVAQQVAQAKAGDGGPPPTRSHPVRPPRQRGRQGATGAAPGTVTGSHGALVVSHHGNTIDVSKPGKPHHSSNRTLAVFAAVITVLVASGMAVRRRRTTNVGHVPGQPDGRS